MTYLYKLTLLIPFILLTGCKSIDVQGQLINDDIVQEINKQHPSKDQLIEKIGNPTYIPDYSHDTWYYIQRSLTKRAYFEPKVIEQKIVKIKFKGDKVLDALVLNNSHNEEIASHSTYTKTYGTEQNGIQKFVKNIGRFSKSADGKKRKKKSK